MHPRHGRVLATMSGACDKPTFFEGPGCFTWQVRPIGFTRLNWIFLHTPVKRAAETCAKTQNQVELAENMLGYLTGSGKPGSHPHGVRIRGILTPPVFLTSNLMPVTSPRYSATNQKHLSQGGGLGTVRYLYRSVERDLNPFVNYRKNRAFIPKNRPAQVLGSAFWMPVWPVLPPFQPESRWPSPVLPRPELLSRL